MIRPIDLVIFFLVIVGSVGAGLTVSANLEDCKASSPAWSSK